MAVSSLNRYLILIIMVANNTLAELQNRPDICPEARCGENGPPIRFPFRLKDNHSRPDNGCSYPGFDLVCVDSRTALHLRSPIDPIFVTEIDYKSKELQVYSESNCLLTLLLSEFNNQSVDSAFPFKYRGDRKSSYTLLNCSTRGVRCRTLLVRSDSEIQASYNDVVSCIKVREFESVPDEIYSLLWRGYRGTNVALTWFRPDCRHCESNGYGCKLKKIGADNDDTECFELVKAKSEFSSVMWTTAIATLGWIIVLLAAAAMVYVHTSKKKQKDSDARIEKFLDDYNALKPSRYKYADIKKITNQFKDIIGEGSYGTVYKGKLSNDVLVAVKILKNSKGNGEEFINEVAMMIQIYHVNVIRLVGYCADGFRRALIFEFLPNGSLEKYIENPSLGWETMYDIALGIAKGIEYLHQGCDKRILHFDIKPRNVLLDRNFVPKISDFGLAKLCGKDQSAVSMNTARGTMGYIAPEVFSRHFGNVSHKSDVYSFGMLLLEMVGGRKNTNPDDEKGDEIFYPEWIYNLLEGGEDVRILVEEESNARIVKKLAIVGLWCIQWHPMDRPTMKFVVQNLEGGEELTVPPNPFASVSSSGSNSKKRARRLALELEAIAE